MTPLFAIAENLLIDRLVSNDAPLTGKSKAGIGLTFFAGFMLLTACGFFIYAAYLWMSSRFEPEIAASIAGGFTLMLSALCALGAYAIVQYKRYRLSKLKSEITDTMYSALDLAETELAEPIKNNPKTAVLVASLAGFIAGEKFL